MHQSDQNPSNSCKNNSDSAIPLLSDGRVLSALKHPFEQAGSTFFFFVGTDGGGINWGISETEGVFPKEWNIVNMSDTPVLQSDHIRFMVLGKYSSQDCMLYAATYGGVSYALYKPDKACFGPWKTATRLEFLGSNLNSDKNHIRSIHIAYTDPLSLNKAKLYIATDQGLWVTVLNQEGEPSEWKNLGLGVTSISSVYATGDHDKDLLLVGTTDRGLAIGLIQGNNIHWQYYDTTQGIASDHIWDVFTTGKSLGDSIIVGTNGGGISWAQIETISEDYFQLSEWKTVDTNNHGFPNNSNAQLFASGNKLGDTLWVATRAGLAWSHFDDCYNLNNWQNVLIPNTTNDIGSVCIEDGWITLGIYRTGIAISKLNEKGNPTTWRVAQAKDNTGH